MLVLTTLLAALAAGAMGAQSASALGLKVCKEVPGKLEGVFTTNTCAVEGGTKKFAWAFPAIGGLSYCVPAVNGGFEESLCLVNDPTGPFERMQSTVTNPSLLGKETGTYTLKGKAGGIKIEIQCTKSFLKATPETEVKLKEIKIEFRGCTVSPKSCTVMEPIVIEADGEIQAGPVLQLSEVSGKITLLGATCALAGNYEISGSQKCKFDAAIGLAREEHEIICAAAESSLLIGGVAATYEGTHKVTVEEVVRWKIK